MSMTHDNETVEVCMTVTRHIVAEVIRDQFGVQVVACIDDGENDFHLFADEVEEAKRKALEHLDAEPSGVDEYKQYLVDTGRMTP